MPSANVRDASVCILPALNIKYYASMNWIISEFFLFPSHLQPRQRLSIQTYRQGRHFNP